MKLARLAGAKIPELTAAGNHRALDCSGKSLGFAGLCWPRQAWMPSDSIVISILGRESVIIQSA
jgi:hypothetical protein